MHNKASQNRSTACYWTRASARLCLRRYVITMKRILFLLLITTNVVASEKYPSNFLGVDLLETTIFDVQDRFGNTKLSELPRGHHDKGLCYLNNGISVVFSTGPMGGNELITGIRLSNSTPEIDCLKVKIEIPSCINHLCLEQTQEEFESKVGKEFTKTTDGNSYVTSNQYQRDMTPLELEKNPYSKDYPYFDVSHNLWFMISSNKISTIGIYKFETN